MTVPEFSPAFWFLAGAVAMLVLPARARASAFLLFPLASLIHIWFLPTGVLQAYAYLDHELILLRVDGFSRGFGLAFSLAALVIGIFSLRVTDRLQQTAALFYAGGSIGVTFAGDFFTLLIFWEVMAVASAMIIWAGPGRAAAGAGLRYLIFHLFGGALLLAGIVLLWHGGGGLEIRRFDAAASPAVILILLGVLVNAAMPPLHAWLPDSYPKAGVTGSIFLNAFTTKVAVYVLIQCFAGWEILMWAGCFMALYAVCYAVMANDIRLILSYHIISQVGYMIAVIGVGTEFALSAASLHAYNNIIYKTLLFMGTGVVLHAVGTTRLTDLGGLARRMPLVVALYMIGAFAISGFPLFSGFVSKAMILEAMGENGGWLVHVLLLAAVGTFLSVGIKLPYYTWFYRESGLEVKPYPAHMPLAMAILAAACLAFGMVPGWLFAWAPSAVEFQPYSVYQVVEALQLPLATFVAFWFFRHKILGEPKIALDLDWFYRKSAPLWETLFITRVNRVFSATQDILDHWTEKAFAFARNPARLLREVPDRFDANLQRADLGSNVGLILVVVVLLTLLSLW